MKQMHLDVPDFELKGFALLRYAFSLFFRNAGPIFLLTALIAVPVEIIKNYYFVDWNDYGEIYSSPRYDNIAKLLFLCATTPMVVHFILGKMKQANLSFRSSIQWGVRKWIRMIMYSFLQSVIIIAGIFLLIIPGLIYAVRLILMPIIVSVENTSAINPMELSRTMSRGRYFKFAGYALTGYAAMLTFTIIITTAPMLLSTMTSIDHWIVWAAFDVLFDWFSQLLIVILLLVYLKVRTANKPLPIDLNK